MCECTCRGRSMTRLLPLLVVMMLAMLASVGTAAGATTWVVDVYKRLTLIGAGASVVTVRAANSNDALNNDYGIYLLFSIHKAVQGFLYIFLSIL
jgi:hypothetical protein